MKERTFRKPTVRELFQMQGIEIPDRLTSGSILSLLNEGILIPSGDSYESAVKAVEGLRERDKCLVLFTSRFRVPKQETDYGIKSLEELVKIDSQQVLKDTARKEDVPNRLTREFLKTHRVWPYTLTKTAMKYENIENPPIGFYWVGTDNHVRATTWMNPAAGAEMQVMKWGGDFEGEVIDPKPYGRNLRVRVSSRTEEGKNYEFTLFRLPIHRTRDPRQFSDWINIGHNSSDPDASYRGLEHDKRVFPVIFWSASTIFSFYEAMRFVKQHPDWRQFRINPFPIPANEGMIDYVDNLRLRSVILDDTEGKLGLRVLNKTEMSRFMGARTILRKYDNCWFHWGKRDLSFLYTPRS